MLLVVPSFVFAEQGNLFTYYFGNGRTYYLNATSGMMVGLNLSCSNIVGASYNVCAGDGSGSGSVDYSKIQNFSNSPCPVGQYVYDRLQNGTFLCRADATGTSVNMNDYWNMSKETLGYKNLTLCSEGQLIKVSSGVWTCSADATAGAGGGNVTAVAFTGTSTKTLTVTNSDGTQVTGTFTDLTNTTDEIKLASNYTALLKNDSITTDGNFTWSSQLRKLNLAGVNLITFLSNTFASIANINIWISTNTTYAITTANTNIANNRTDLINLFSANDTRIESKLDSLGNWSFDKSKYLNSTQTLSEISGLNTTITGRNYVLPSNLATNLSIYATNTNLQTNLSLYPTKTDLVNNITLFVKNNTDVTFTKINNATSYSLNSTCYVISYDTAQLRLGSSC